MIKATMQQYDAYKDSGVEWLGEVPEHWDMMRLKELTTIQNSNVDKKSHTNEISVSLCNYVDVYKNEFIDSSLDFMKATADESEIKRFTILKSDVFITKDSETCDDIAEPALATEMLEGVLCGYHLAQFRTKQKMLLGSYLFRLFQSKKYGFRFVISAKGITRVGLGQSAIADSLTPVPPLSEQNAIAVYLDTKTAQIDRKIDLLTQKATQYSKLKQSLINEIVTRGLDKTVAMKDSGVEWIGEVPEHWDVNRLKDVFNERADKGYPDEPLLIASQDKGVTLKASYSRHTMTVQKDFHMQKLVKKADFVISLRSFEGGIESAHYQGIISAAYTILYPINEHGSGYYKHLFKSKKFISLLVTHTTGIREGRNINYQQLKRDVIPVPDPIERQKIALYLDEKTAHIDHIVETINTQIEKLKELRKTLINDVVTGKIKVA